MNSFQKDLVAITPDHVGLFPFATVMTVLNDDTDENNFSLPVLKPTVDRTSITIGDGYYSTSRPYISTITWDIALESGYLGFVCIAAIVANFLVAYTLIRKEQLMVPSNRLVFNLTASNFVFSLLILPFVVVSTAQQKWLFGIFWCNFSGFFTLLVGIASILTSAMIAIDRYYAIVKPMVYIRTITVAKSTAMLLWVWIQATICSLPPLFGWSRFDCLKTKATCTVVWREDLIYTTFLLLFCVLLPFSIMASCYYHIFQVVRGKCRKINVGTVNNPTLNVEAINGDQPSINKHQTCTVTSIEQPLPSLAKRPAGTHKPRLGNLPRRKSSLALISSYSSLTKGFRTICIVIGMFLVTYGPYITVAIVDVFCEHLIKINDVFRLITIWLLYSSSVGYPIVYGVYNRSIRKEIKTCLCPPSSKALKGLPRRNSRRLSFSGGLFDYAPFRVAGGGRNFAASSLSTRISFDYGRASIDLGSLAKFRRATSTRRPSQDSGAIMTESDMDTDFSFPPSLWFRRGSFSSRTGLHPVSAKLGFLRRRPSSPTVSTQPFPILQIVDVTDSLTPSKLAIPTDVHIKPLEHPAQQTKLVDILSLPGGCMIENPNEEQSEITKTAGLSFLRVDKHDIENDNGLLFIRKCGALKIRDTSLDEGIVNDCIVQDVE